MKKRSLSFHLGNSILIAALIGFLYLFFPFIQIYLFPPKIQAVLPTHGTFITIPKISAQAPVIEQVDPSNQTIYDEALKKGVAQAKGTSLPGQKGTMYLFAHSSGPIWEESWSNTLFLRLGDLKPGDLITIRRNGKDFTYKVRESKVVSPSDVTYLLNTKRTQLILQTCTPIPTSLFRLLVFADPAS